MSSPGSVAQEMAFDPATPPVIEGFTPSPQRLRDESVKDKFQRKIRENPVVPIGEGVQGGRHWRTRPKEGAESACWRREPPRSPRRHLRPPKSFPIPSHFEFTNFVCLVPPPAAAGCNPLRPPPTSHASGGRDCFVFCLLLNGRQAPGLEYQRRLVNACWV